MIFTQLCMKATLPRPEKEHQFHPVRKWRFDYCWVKEKIALEVEGGAHTQGRHTRGKGFIADMEKYNTATVMGWRIIRVTPQDLLKFSTIEMIKQLLKTT